MPQLYFHFTIFAIIGHTFPHTCLFIWGSLISFYLPIPNFEFSPAAHYSPCCPLSRTLFGFLLNAVISFLHLLSLSCLSVRDFRLWHNQDWKQDLCINLLLPPWAHSTEMCVIHSQLDYLPMMSLPSPPINLLEAKIESLVVGAQVLWWEWEQILCPFL